MKTKAHFFNAAIWDTILEPALPEEQASATKVRFFHLPSCPFYLPIPRRSAAGTPPLPSAAQPTRAHHPQPTPPLPRFAPPQIVCTIGPSCQSVEVLCEMIENGMSAARIDLTWGPIEYHQRSEFPRRREFDFS
jgi:hypothetical protein